MKSWTERWQYANLTNQVCRIPKREHRLWCIVHAPLLLLGVIVAIILKLKEKVCPEQKYH